MDRLTKAMDKYLTDVTKVTEQQMVNSKLASKALDMAEHRKRLLILKARILKLKVIITQETYEALKDARKKLKNWKGDTKKMLFEGQAQDLYDLLDTTIRELDDENKMTNVPDRVFLVIGEDTPDGADFDELDEVTWSKERVSYKDIEYTRKK